MKYHKATPVCLIQSLASRLAFAAILFSLSPCSVVHAWNSAKVVVDANGRLSYPADASGNRIPDFSHAGYKGGGVALPTTTIPVVKTISPIAGDNTAAIQAAINEVGAMPIQADGYRGRLQLSAGLYSVSGTLLLNKSGVVLSGAGNGSDPATNTVLQRTGTSEATVIAAGGGVDDDFATAVAGSTSNIIDATVQVGSRSFNVDNPGLYIVGDSIVINHPVTQAWLNAVDTSNVWSTGTAGLNIRYVRSITAISGTTITVDAPIFNNLTKSLTQSTVYKYNLSAYLTNIGIQDLFVDIVTAGSTSDTHCWDAISFIQAKDCWIFNTTAQHFRHAGIVFGGAAINCTALQCWALDPHSPIIGERRDNFMTYHSSQNILFDTCYARDARHAFMNSGYASSSGTVFVDCTIDHPYNASEGHRLWPTALLFDRVNVINRVAADVSFVLGLYNRGTFGSGHGWSAAHSVMWACDGAGDNIYNQQPPTAQNYAIGCFGIVDGNGPHPGATGYIEGTGVTGLLPASLYRAQLSDRLGTTTVAAPSFTPPAGTYSTSQSVTITSATSGASIRYTVDGSTPTSTIGTLYSAPVNIAATTTLKAIAYASGMADSTVTSGLYTITSTGLPAPWLTADIGAVGIVGSANESAGSYTVTGSGTGFMSTSDQFRYVYQTLTGDGSITAKVSSQSGTVNTSRAGVMIRESTATGSSFVAVVHRGSGGNNMQSIRRTSTGATTSSTSSTSQTPPNCWVRITRTGGSFVQQRSTDGTTWTTINTNTITMAANITIGLVVTSGSNTVLDTDVFTNVTVVP